MPHIGELSALLTAVFWSITSFAFSSAAIKLGSLTLNINRMMLASILLALTIVVFRFDYILSANQIFNLVLSGIVGLVIGDTFLFKSFQYIGARIGMLMMALSPVMSGVLAYIFLGEDMSMWGILGMAITIGGVVLVISERKETETSEYRISKIGIFHGLMGALGQAGGLIFAKFAFEEGEVNKIVATFVRIISSVIILTILAVLMRRYKNPIKVYKENPKALTSTAIGTFFGPYLGITFSLIAIANTKVGIAATLMSTMPIIMLPMVRYYFKEKLSWRAIGGHLLPLPVLR
ncbi:MAG: DMT family transporter [Ignavibacteriaceae bacterium]|nr:DMT family transporter [Ignavibacteriaceae bacterium]